MPHGSRRHSTRRVPDWRFIGGSLLIATVAGLVLWGWHAYQLTRLASTLLLQAEMAERTGRWSEASDRLFQYLQFQPNDPATLKRLANASFEQSNSPGRIATAIRWHYQALGYQADNHSLRLQLADLLLRAQSYGRAREESQRVLKGDPDRAAAVATLALSHYRESRQLHRVVTRQTMEMLERAHRLLPDDMRVARALLDTYRTHPPGTTQTDLRREAAGVLAALVEARAADPAAYLLRHHYRRHFGLEEHDEDLRTALELAPQEPAVLQAAGLYYRRARGPVEGAEYFEQLTVTAPDNHIGFLYLGDCQWQSDQREQAIDTWKVGVKRTRHLDLYFRIVDGLLQFGRAEESVATLVSAETLLSRLSHQHPRRAEWEETATLARAKRLTLQGDGRAAIPLLERVALAPGTDTRFAGQVRRKRQAWLLLASIHAEFARWEQSADAYERSCEGRDSAVALVAAATAWKRAGYPDRGAPLCQRAVAQRPSMAEAWLLLGQLELEILLAHRAGLRDWSRIERTLRNARERGADSWQLSMLEAEVAAHRFPGPGRALSILWEAELKFPQEPAFWHRLPLFYERLGRAADADRALERGRQLASGSPEVQLRQIELLLQRRRFAEANHLLDGLRQAVNADADSRFWEVAARVQRSTGRIDAYRQSLLRMVQLAPQSREVLLALAELHLDASDLNAGDLDALALDAADTCRFDGLVQQLQAIEGEGGLLSPYLRTHGQVAKLVDRPPSDTLTLVQESIDQLRRYKSRWPQLDLLQAKVAAKRGDLRGVLENLANAERFGASPAVVRARGVLVLCHHGQFARAAEWARSADFPSPVSSSPHADIRPADEFTYLCALAEKGAERRPDAAEPWRDLGLLRLLAGDLPAATEALRRADQLHPSDSRTLLALVWAAGAAGNRTEGNAYLAQIKDASWVSSADREFALGQGAELLSDLPQAKLHYTSARASDPQYVPATLRLAKCLSPEDRAAALSLLDEVSQLLPANRDVHDVRSSLLATTTGRAAVEDPPVNPSVDETSPDPTRLQVMDLIHEGTPESRARAAELLQRILETPGEHVTQDHLTLAGLLEQLGDLEGAKRIFQQLIAAHPSPPSNWAYIEFLIRQHYYDEAHQNLEAQEDAATWPVVALRARYLAAVGRVAEVAPLLKAALPPLLVDSPLEEEQLLVEAAGLCVQLGDPESANPWYERFVARYSDRIAARALYLLQQQRPEESVRLCLHALRAPEHGPSHAMLLARVMLNHATDPRIAQLAEPALRHHLAIEAENPLFLFDLSNIRLQQGDIPTAIELLRKVTDLDPQQPIAWNNLAALLAESPQHQDEALRCIQRALEVAEIPMATLLDTKAMVLLHQGQVADALAILREITADGEGNDPRFFLHLGIALHRAGVVDESQQTIEQAHSMGLASTFLTQLERDLYAQLRRSSPP